MVLIRNIIPIVHTVGSRGARTKRSRPTVLFSWGAGRGSISTAVVNAHDPTDVVIEESSSTTNLSLGYQTNGQVED